MIALRIRDFRSADAQRIVDPMNLDLFEPRADRGRSIHR